MHYDRTHLYSPGTPGGQAQTRSPTLGLEMIQSQFNDAQRLKCEKFCRGTVEGQRCAASGSLVSGSNFPHAPAVASSLVREVVADDMVRWANPDWLPHDKEIHVERTYV